MNRSTEPQTEALGRWLDAAPGTPPPSDLDADVVEAVYALRPELAPAPRVTADDILASLTAGPLAGPVSGSAGPEDEREAEVVPFPSRARPETTSEQAPTVEAQPRGARRGPPWKWVGGTGGVGMALVAAATLLLVVTPVLQQQAPEQAREASPAAQVASSRAEEAPAGPAVGEVERRTVASSPAAGAPAEVEGGASRGPSGPAEPAVLPMAEAPALDRPDLIPELSEPVQTVATGSEVVGGVELDAVADADDAVAPAQAAPLADEEGAAEEWRRGTSAKAQGRVDQAVAAAASLRGAGDRAGAARALEAAVDGVPARAGQHLLGLAAQEWLAAGDRVAARAAAERGLALSKADSAERRRLEQILASL